MIKDFEKFFTEVQKQYNDLNKTLEKVNKELEEGKCTNEQRDAFESYFNTIKCNYDRLSYVRYLLHLPPKFIQKINEKRLIDENRKFKKLNADKESTLLENDDALQSMKVELCNIVDDKEGIDE